MKIAFTGGSSFTGMWFVQRLLNEGHEVTAIFQKPFDGYHGMRGRRLNRLKAKCQTVFECSFGSDLFLDLLKAHSFDLLCHHAAAVTDYRSPSFDVTAAVANNTHNIRAVLTTLYGSGCRHLLLTGSIFEQNEGSCSAGARAISPYGLSKGLTSDMFTYFCRAHGIKLGKFVIPNPYGPFEEERFTSYLAEKWLGGEIPIVKTPAYIRDNIPVTLLAEAYTHFSAALCSSDGTAEKPLKSNPSFRPETIKAFTLRFACEMEKRLRLPCPIHFHHQTEFPEPERRVNTDAIATTGWDEGQFLDQLADFYRSHPDLNLLVN